MTLNPAKLMTRLALDYRTTMPLESPAIGAIRAFPSLTAFRSGEEVKPPEGQSGRATIYVVDLVFPVLTGPGMTTSGTTLLFDLLAGGNYPFDAPLVAVASTPPPWSPHVHPTTGLVCVGTSWDSAHGTMLLAQLITHLIRILNCDEKDQLGYVGWNEAAIKYWRTELDCRPLNPTLRYPLLPDEITGANGPPPQFRRKSNDAQAGQTDRSAVSFRPRGCQAPAMFGRAKCVTAGKGRFST
jgi:hypothetical protein